MPAAVSDGLRPALIAFLGGACSRCGWHEHPAGLQVHHTDPARKTRSFESGKLSLIDMTSIDFLEELATCRLLCANCHALHHAKERDADT